MSSLKQSALWLFFVVDFVRSGSFYLPGASGATYSYAGVYGRYWSSRGLSTHANGSAIPSTYYLGFNATDVYPSGGPDTRWDGFPLRCLSTVIDILE